VNRLQYWIKAQTQYRVHSPFVFDMYRKVLFARVKGTPIPQGQSASRRYHEIVYKVQDHYGLQVSCYDEDEAVLTCGDETRFAIKVVNHPHHCKARELRWMSQQQNEKYHISIDLYDVGLLVTNPKLRRQHFTLI